MSAETDSTTKRIRLFVRLLNEGTEVSRPTDALDLGNGLYKLLATANYDPEDEIWEFPPGSIVKGEVRSGTSGKYLMAAKAVSKT
jgi:hypothetical protein